MNRAFTGAAREGTSTGFLRAGVSVTAPASLAESAGLLSSVNAFIDVVASIIYERDGMSRAENRNANKKG